MSTPRNTVLYISQSLTSSTKEEMMLMQIKSGEDGNTYNYFVEYKTNLPPSTHFLSEKDDGVVRLSLDKYLILKGLFEQYHAIQRVSPYLHAPSYIIGGLTACTVTHLELGILL